MQPTDWASLTQLQLHDRATDLVEQRFIARGFRTRRDSGDELFVQRSGGTEYHVAVIGARSRRSYYYVLKRRLVGEHILIALVWAGDDEPEVFLIPEGAFKSPQPGHETTLADRDYDGKKSEPEYGITLTSPHNLTVLEGSFRFDHIALNL